MRSRLLLFVRSWLKRQQEAGAGERCRGERGRAGAVLRQSSQGGRRKAESQVRRSTQGPAAIACPGCSALCPAAWSQQALPGQLVQRGEVDLERPSAQPPCRRERLSGRQSGPPRTPHAGSAAETPGKHLGSPRLVALSGSLSSLQRVPGPPVHLIDHGCWRLHHTGAEASNVCRTNHQRGSAHGVVSIRPFGSAPPAGARHHATAGLQQKCETFMDVRGSPPRPRARPQTTPTTTALCQHRRPKGPRHPSKHRFLAGVDDTQHRRRQSSEPLAAQSAPSSLVVAAAAWRTSPTLSISPMTDAEDPPDSECSFPPPPMDYSPSPRRHGCPSETLPQERETRCRPLGGRDGRPRGHDEVEVPYWGNVLADVEVAQGPPVMTRCAYESDAMMSSLYTLLWMLCTDVRRASLQADDVQRELSEAVAAACLPSGTTRNMLRQVQVLIGPTGRLVEGLNRTGSGPAGALRGAPDGSLSKGGLWRVRPRTGAVVRRGRLWRVGGGGRGG